MDTSHAQISKWQSELLPHMVDRLAQETPEAVYAVWPVALTSPKAGFRFITYRQLANVINGLAPLLQQQLGPGNGAVLAYVGPNDVRLTALALASIKAGHVRDQLFLTSPRNSPAAHRELFKALSCQTLVTTNPAPPSAQAIIEAVQPLQFIIPSVDELLEETYPPFEYQRSFEEGLRDGLWVIHTSGSTGLPKPLVWTQAAAARHHECASRTAWQGATSVDSLLAGRRVFVTVPPFHGAGLGQYLLWAIPFGTVPIAPAAAGIVTAQGLVDSLRELEPPAEVAVLVPSVVAELAQDAGLLDYCARHLKLILYIGGDLPQAVGDLVARKIQLRCWWGASECGIPHQLIPHGLGELDWRYIQFHPSVGAVFDPVTEDTCELVIKRDDTLPQTCFSIRGQDQPQLTEYRTKDLFTPHPMVENAWCWRARADDIIVFLNGEKTNPVSMEQHVVSRNPELSGVLVIGSHRLQAALLIEPVASSPVSSVSQQAALIEKIWPSIQEANNLAPAHARVDKAFVLITAPDRPFIRAGKGTIQRGASLVQYASEMDTLYKNADLGTDDEITSGYTLEPSSPSTVGLFVREAVRSVTAWAEVDEDANFFELGMNSLQALQLTRALRRRLNRPDVALPTIYNNPTASGLTAAILTQKDEDTDKDLMEPLLKTYKDLILQIPPREHREAAEQLAPFDVVLTGSTGTLGTFILREILSRSAVVHIFCLNRGEDGGRASQQARFDAAGLATDDLSGRVTFLKADLSSPRLGLEKATYDHLRARARIIIHNAWPVNFNLGLAAFRPQLAGLVNLFVLASAAEPAHTPHLVFVSSVGAVGGLASEASPVAEKIMSSMDTPYSNGYARSKFLSELLCETAASHLRLPVTVARVGQVAGAVRRPGGIWNRTEWLPSLVVSSVLRLGCIPDNIGRQFSEVDWVPSDLLAEAMVDLATRDDLHHGAVVFNLRNPQTTTWKSLLPAVIDAAGSQLGRPLEAVSSSAWLARLSDSEHEHIEDGDSVTTSNPAMKLFTFYRDGIWGGSEAAKSPTYFEPMEVKNSLTASPALRSLSAVSPEWMRKWVGEWLATSDLGAQQ